MTKLTREEKREVYAKGTPEAKRLLQAQSDLEFAERKLVQERDEFGTIGAKLAFYENQVAEKQAAFDEARRAYQS